MDALSLSHLTYRFATLTINFHRLDHPPFPCKKTITEELTSGQVQAFRVGKMKGGEEIAPEIQASFNFLLENR